MPDFEKLLNDLASNDGRVSPARLTSLSGMMPEELPTFQKARNDLPAARRKSVVELLIQLAEDNVELDFFSIFKLALNDEDEETRIGAISGLWECEERALIGLLIRMLTVDTSEKVRAAAAQALGRFSYLAETGKLLQRDGRRVSDALIETIDSEFEAIEVRRRAIEALAAMSHPRVPDIIREAYESDEVLVKASSLFAMGRTCDTKWLTELLEEVNSHVPGLRYEAVTALGEIGDEKAIPALLMMIDDQDADVQAAVLLSLGKIGGPVAKKALSRTAQHGGERMQELAKSAIEAVDELDSPMVERRN